MTMKIDRRQRLLDRLETTWMDFRQSYAGLSADDLLNPGVTGHWSVRDIIAHVTTWEEETLKHLAAMLRGEKCPRYSVQYGGINAFNALMTETKKNLTLSEVIRQQADVHAPVIRLIESVPEEYLDSKSRFRHRLRMDTYSHYPKHAQAIRRWRNL